MINFIYTLNAIVSSWRCLDRLKFCMLLLRSIVMSLKQSLSSSHRHKYMVFCLFYPGHLWKTLNTQMKQKILLQGKI